MESLAETLRRLEQEREQADRAYNDALTALDRSIAPPPNLPSPGATFDAHQLAQLNDAWNIVPGPPAESGLKGRLAGFVWRLVAPYFQRQLTFNSWLVDHLNRNAAAAREAQRVSEETIATWRSHAAAQAQFQSHLLQLLQQVTAYVDTRDRASGGGALILNQAISSVAENVDKRAESMAAAGAARDAAIDAKVAALAASDETIRGSLAILQQASLALKREVERLVTSAGEPIARPADSVPRAPGDQAFTPALDAYKYLAFEDRFRGSREEIRRRLESYLPFFAGASDVLDVGCGRGEFLELLSSAGVRARGLDLNHEMVESCRSRGLDVAEADVVSYLRSLPDHSLGGLFAAQVVEHLQPAYLLEFLELAYHKTRPGSRVVLETLNPACWVAFFESYIRDITHVWPLHPETLQFLVLASGFTQADIEYRSPVPPRDRLQQLRIPDGADPVIVDYAETFNGNVERLNARIFTYLDYAIVGSR